MKNILNLKEKGIDTIIKKRKKKTKIKTKMKIPQIKLYEFNVYNEMEEKDIPDDNDDAGNSYVEKKDENKFIMQMFGMDEKGNDYSLYVNGFNPFFYVKVSDNWKEKDVVPFINHLKSQISGSSRSKYYDTSIVTSKCKLVERETLYGFDKNKKHKFIYIEVTNTRVFNKLTNLWYSNATNFMKKKLRKKGYEYELPRNKNLDLFIYTRLICLRY